MLKPRITRNTKGELVALVPMVTIDPDGTVHHGKEWREYPICAYLAFLEYNKERGRN